MPSAFSARVARLVGPLRRALRNALDAALAAPSLQPVSSMSGPSKPTGSALARWAQYPRPYGSVGPVPDTRSGRKGGPCSSGSPVGQRRNGGTCGVWADGRQAFGPAFRSLTAAPGPDRSTARAAETRFRAHCKAGECSIRRTAVVRTRMPGGVWYILVLSSYPPSAPRYETNPTGFSESQAHVSATCIDIAGLSRVEGETLWSLTHHAFALVMLKISISKPEAARTSHRHRGDSPCILIHLRCWLR
jgi:hypothetical protein